ncbi:unnamed protein product [Eruca vesicaria subsp. sativa]|uniref:Uncharacterized protein n=1 Tax=Eruca vesicaria subsp. sativa TaxID=29727 RepID=A0ABC8LKE1_ERUVS|nr:unnamed protein product [Eruca vesicaria subsp. sativa]
MTKGSIFAKLSGLSGNPNWNSVAVTKEQAGLIVRGVVVKGIIGYFGYELGTMMFSNAPKIERYEVLLQKARGVIKNQERNLRLLDKREAELVQAKEKINKELMKYHSRASN